MEPKFTINGKVFVFNLSVETDELCAPIESEMYKAIPEAFTIVADSLGKLGDLKKPQTDVEWEAAKKVIATGAISIGYSMIRITHWLREKKYTRKLMAILLLPEGTEFNESDLPEREEFMRKYGTKKISMEVIQHFFLRSGG
jgi:hypothetical protein